MTAPHLHLAPAPGRPDASKSGLASIRVVLADDHQLMRRSLRLLLDGEGDISVIAEACDLVSVLREVRAHRPDVLVLDLRMSGGSSIETIGRLRVRAPDTQIVALTMDDNPVFARGAFAAGAIGFVLKELADSELPQAIRAAARGEGYVSPRVAARLAALRRTDSRPGLAIA